MKPVQKIRDRKTARKDARIEKKQRKAQNYTVRKIRKKQEVYKKKFKKYVTDRELQSNPKKPSAQDTTQRPLKAIRKSKAINFGKSATKGFDDYTAVHTDPLLAFAERAIDAGILGSDGDFDEDKMNNLFADLKNGTESEYEDENEEEYESGSESEISINSDENDYLQGATENSELDDSPLSHEEEYQTGRKESLDRPNEKVLTAKRKRSLDGPSETKVLATKRKESPDQSDDIKMSAVKRSMAVDNTKLQRVINGFINRLTLSNFDSVSKSLVDLFLSHPRHEVTELMIQSLVNSITKQPNLLDSFITTFAALISATAHFSGIDLVGNILERCISIIDSNRPLCKEQQVESESITPGKIIMNCITLVAFLYDLRVITSLPIMNLIEEAVENMHEIDVEVLVKLVRTCGAQLRRDDPGSLKGVILNILDKASNKPPAEQSSRFKFMIETIQDLKNNKQKLVAIQHGELESAKKTLRSFLLANNKSKLEPLAIGLKDIRDAETKGKWWKIGAAWNPGCEEPAPSKEAQITEGNEILQVAKRHNMNTDVRRTIFTTLMSSEDYIDAFQRLLSLKLASRQEREIAHVLLHCCTSEKVYNPFYSLVANKFAGARHNFVITFKYAFWDRLKQVDAEEIKFREMIHIAKFYGFLFSKGSVPLSSLKRASFAQLSETGIVFFQTLLTTFFEKIKDETFLVVLISRLKDITVGGKKQVKDTLFGSDEDDDKGTEDEDEDELDMKKQEIENLRSGLRIFCKQFLKNNLDPALLTTNPETLNRRIDLAIAGLE